MDDCFIHFFFTVYNSWPYHRLLVFQVFSVLNEWRWIRNLDCLWLLGIIDGSSLGYIRPPKLNMPMIEIEAQVHWFGGYKSTIAASWWFFPESSSSYRMTPTAVVSIRIQSRANIKTANFWNWRMVTSDGFLKKNEMWRMRLPSSGGHVQITLITVSFHTGLFFPSPLFCGVLFAIHCCPLPFYSTCGIAGVLQFTVHGQIWPRTRTIHQEPTAPSGQLPGSSSIIPLLWSV